MQRILRSMLKSLNSLPVALAATVGSIAAISAVYLGYDLVKSRITPCEQVFQQTNIGLNTKIRVLQAEGEVQLGRDTLTELSERAQMVALNLKTCCTVLDSGRINPEQFLQCKGKARQFEAKVKNVVKLVAAAAPTETASITPAAAAAAKVAKLPGPTLAAATAPPPSLKKAVDDAREVSREFNNKVMVVQKEQAIRALESQPASNVDVSSAEHEPNNDLLNLNVLPLDTWISRCDQSRQGQRLLHIYNAAGFPRLDPH